jgi:hypothetical protein
MHGTDRTFVPGKWYAMSLYEPEMGQVLMLSKTYEAELYPAKTHETAAAYLVDPMFSNPEEGRWDIADTCGYSAWIHDPEAWSPLPDPTGPVIGG